MDFLIILYKKGLILLKKTLNVGGYARVSHEEQKKYGFSISAQTDAIKDWCKLNNHNLINLYVDEGFSASNMKRPQLQKMLNDLDKLDAIIFTRLDRLSRNVFEANKMLNMFKEKNTDMIAISEEYVDTTKSNGLMMFNLKMTLAQHELDKGSERIKAVFEYKIKDSQAISGKLPYGYRIGLVDGKKRVVFDETTKHIVDDIFDYFKKHHSVRKTMFYINDKYDLNRNYSTYRKLFNNIFYAGNYRNNTNYCPPYITIEQYNDNQKILRNNVKVGYNRATYLFSGLIHCPVCNHKMSGFRQSNTKKLWYRCNNQRISKSCSYSKVIREEIIEQFLLENIEKDFENYVFEFEQKAKKQNKNPTKKINAIKQELENLNYLFRKNRIKLNEYEFAYDELEKELKILETSIIEKNFSETQTFFKSDWKELYNGLSKENQRALWRNLISSIEISENKDIKVNF